MFNSHSQYRGRALKSEHRARVARDPEIKREWEELAIEWHLMANSAAQSVGENPQIEII
jgi:hypothetical protein